MSRVGILLHRSLDADIAHRIAKTCAANGVECDLLLADAALDPAALARWLAQFQAGGGGVILSFDSAGGVLSALAAAQTLVPVVSVPTSSSREPDDELPTDDMGLSGFTIGPVAEVPHGDIGDAVQFALRVLALRDEKLSAQLAAVRHGLRRELQTNTERLRETLHQLNDEESSSQGEAKPAAANRKPAEEVIEPADAEMIARFERHLRATLRTSRRDSPYSPPDDGSLPESPALAQVYAAARILAARSPRQIIHPLHLLGALASSRNTAARDVLETAGAPVGHLLVIVDTVMAEIGNDEPEAIAQGAQTETISPIEKLSNSAAELAREASRTCVTTLDLLQALALDSAPEVVDCLLASGTSAERLVAALKSTDASRECGGPGDQKAKSGKSWIPSDPRAEILLKVNAGFAGDAGSDESADASSEENDEEASPPARIMRLSADNPDFDVVEEIADTLLEGHIVAFPTDLGFVMGVDATNAASVQRLRRVAGRPDDEPVGVLINSLSQQLKLLARSIPQGVEPMVDTLWPGPLMVVFERHPDRFRALAREATIGVRIPEPYLALSILGMFNRPVAAISVPPETAETPAVTAEEIPGRFPVAIVVDTGEPLVNREATVLSVVGGEFRILREGVLSRERIEQASPRALSD